jgi:hypothetical protein
MGQNAVASLLIIFHFLLGRQLLTLTHELGHALPILLFSRENVRIQLGKQPAQRSWVLGRVQLDVQLPSFAGFYRYNKNNVSRQLQLLSLFCGPLTSLLWTIILGSLAAVLRNKPELQMWQSVTIIVAADAFLGFILTAVPLKYPDWYGILAGWPSDGYQIRALLQEAKKK